MAETSPAADVGSDGLTRTLAEFAVGIQYGALPDPVREVAKHCVLDGLGSALAGAHEPAAQLVLAEALEQAGAQDAAILGTSERLPVVAAALVNGTATHALDYDDVSATMFGHPTAPVLPAALAIAEREGRSGAEFLAAFIAGVEVESRIGQYLTHAHYRAGYHATGTVGTFGAAVAAAKLLGLDAEGCALTMGIAATQSAGLKSMFGTMCKPLHAGLAASNGLYAALLARRGFSSCADVLECEQGFAESHTTSTDPGAALAGLGETFHIPQTLFKYHAACYSTHAAIDAASQLRDQHGIDPSAIETIEVRVPRASYKHCNILSPSTGLEAKFSLRVTTAMGLLGMNTAAIEAYSEALCADPDIVGLRDRTRIVDVEELDRFNSEVVVSLDDGVVYRAFGDAATPATDFAEQDRRLRAKFSALAGPVVGDQRAEAIINEIAHLEDSKNLRQLIELCRVA